MIGDKLNDFYSSKHPDSSYSSFNQGIMELGETVCVPNGAPQCKKCPLNKNCFAYQNKMTESIPYRSSLKERKILERTLFEFATINHS